MPGKKAVSSQPDFYVPSTEQGRPFGQYLGSNIPSTTQGRPFGQFMGSNIPSTEQGRPFGQFLGSNIPSTEQGRPFGQFLGSNIPSTTQGRPFGQFLGSNIPSTTQGCSGTNPTLNILHFETQVTKCRAKRWLRVLDTEQNSQQQTQLSQNSHQKASIFTFHLFTTGHKQLEATFSRRIQNTPGRITHSKLFFTSSKHKPANLNQHTALDTVQSTANPSKSKQSTKRIFQCLLFTYLPLVTSIWRPVFHDVFGSSQDDARGQREVPEGT